MTPRFKVGVHEDSKCCNHGSPIAVTSSRIHIKQHSRGYPVHRCSQTTSHIYSPKNEHDEVVARAQ